MFGIILQIPQKNTVSPGLHAVTVLVYVGPSPLRTQAQASGGPDLADPYEVSFTVYCSPHRPTHTATAHSADPLAAQRATRSLSTTATATQR